MRSILWCEIMKLKRSKIVLFSILGVMATPCMLFIEALQQHFEYPDKALTLNSAYSNSLLYVMVLINLMIYVAIAAYLFSREYLENTWKTILPIPLSRTMLLTGKFITLLLWVLMLTVVTWAGILGLFAIYHVVIGMEEFGVTVAMQWLVKFLVGNVIVCFTVSPFIYIALKTKGLVAPMIVSAVVVMGNAAVCNQKIGAVYPWTATYLLIADRIQETGYSSVAVVLSIGVTVIAGIVATWIHFQKEDIR